MTESKQNLVWVAVFILIIAVNALVIFFHRSMPKTAKTAQILQNGEVARTVNLDVDKPYEFEVVSEDGHNTIRVENGKIGVVEADCPDKICVSQGFIDNGTLPIVCLPHRLSVVITDNGRDIDAVSGR